MLARFICIRQRALAPRFAEPPLLRLYFSTNTPATEPVWSDRQKRELYDRVNRQKKADLLSWDMLSDFYKAPADFLRDMYDQAVVNAEHDAQVQSKIRDSVQKNHDDTTGRIDWDRVSHEVDLPVLECLQLFSYEQTAIKPREFPTKSAWPKKDLDDMKQFINNNFHGIRSIVWSYVAKYTNTNANDCMNAYGKVKPHKWTDEELQQMGNYRDSGLKWREIKEIMGIPSSVSMYSIAYHIYLRKQNGKVDLFSLFTADERDRIREIIEQNPEYSYKDKKLISIVTAEFPEKSYKDLERVVSKIHNVIKKQRLGYDSLAKVFDLVEIHGQDWIKIGRIMDIHPAIIKDNWENNKDKFYNATREWTEDEIRVFEKCMENGMKTKAISLMIPTKLYIQCKGRIDSLNKTAANIDKPKVRMIQWTKEMEDQLFEMVELRLKKGQKVNWKQIGHEFDCTESAARSKHRIISRLRSSINPGISQMITAAVEKQFKLHGSVDWTEISQSTGQDVKTCLELSQYDEGKASWKYDPETYSRDLEKQVREFIKTHYTLARYTNYRALSNYFWTKLDDSEEMARVTFRCKIKTDPNVAKARELREQGMSYREIALHIGPYINPDTVNHWLNKPPIDRYPWTINEIKRINNILKEGMSKDRTLAQMLDAVVAMFPSVDKKVVYKKVYNMYDRIKVTPSSGLLKDKELVYWQVHKNGIPIEELAKKYKTNTRVIESVLASKLQV